MKKGKKLHSKPKDQMINKNTYDEQNEQRNCRKRMEIKNGKNREK